MKTLISRVTIPAVVATIIVISAIFGFAGALNQGTTSTKYAKWMNSLDDNTSLRNVNMPGSHDTMATYGIGDFAGHCQSLSLNDQLNLGVRFLDIRLKQDRKVLRATHGFIDQKATFSQINETVTNFLNDNPTEFIIMSIKEETKASNPIGSFEDCLKEYLNDKYVLSREVPEKVGDVRGKIVLLSRYPNSTIGIEACNGWQDSTSFTASSNDIYIQDYYKVNSIDDKKNEIVTCFNESGHDLKINFLSGYLKDNFPPSYAPSVAIDINPWINEVIADYNDRNIVLYDFVSESNMDAFFEGAL